MNNSKQNPSPSIRHQIKSALAMQKLGQQLAHAYQNMLLKNPSSQKKSAFIVYLQGELGAGKTTLVRGFLQGYDFTGRVKSPTYTLIEPYQISPLINTLNIYHFDLYRLHDPKELEFIGANDYFQEPSICLIEWPEQGKGHLPPPDLTITISYKNSQQREVSITPSNHFGEQLLLCFHPVKPRPSAHL